jgi:chemotaxis protein CheD
MATTPANKASVGSRIHQRQAQGDIATIKIDPGGHYVTRNNNEMIVTVLGSCVAACIRDPMAQVGGMNHFMLPESDHGNWGAASASLRYGNFAMERLINDILCRGGHRSRLEIKVFGGARMIGSGAQIGPQNADFVESYLRDEGLPIAAAHLRGDHARRVHYFPLTGQVRMLEMPRVESGLAAIEMGYGASLRREAPAGSIELFD